MKKSMLTRKNLKTGLFAVSMVFMLGSFQACTKKTELAEDPYAGGKQVLDINFVSKSSELGIVAAGSVMELQVNGLMKYKDNFKLYVNEIEANVIDFTDTSIRFEIPVTASTGSVWITANEQTFFGPVIRVGGKVSVDNTFKVVNGAGYLSGGVGTIFDIEQLPSGRFWVGGSFNTFELKGTEAVPNGGIAQLDPDGGYITNDINFGFGAWGSGGTIYSISRISAGPQSGKFIIGGSFNAYNSKRNNRQTIGNVTRLNANGTLDTMMSSQRDAAGNSLVPIVNPKPEVKWKDQDTVPSFNASVDGAVRKTFAFGEKVYIIGNFQIFRRAYYPNSTWDEKVYDATRMRQMVRVNADGSLDSTFHYIKATNQSGLGGDGAIMDATMQADGKLVIVGGFQTFNGTPAKRIARLNLDGSVDNSFHTGSGADGDIYAIRYNATTQQYVVSGTFTHYNGKALPGVALLNADGSLVDSFNPQQITGGSVTYSGQLNNGKILVTGNFTKYGEYVRQGFMILEADGTLKPEYNNSGGFQGRVYDMIETPFAGGTKVILVGNILRFNATIPKGLVRITIAN
ncbi:DUF5008 domain-containing protein [Sphingobacterium sp. CZ-2]|nr:DUF5008 domain-containing protein [Sphingobacterium sp. CZ-2]